MRPFLPILLTLTLAATSCSVGPDYQRPLPDMPAAYKNQGQWKTPSPADHVNRGNWWKIFGDAQLSSLLEELNASNQDLKQAEARYREATALTRSIRGELLPQLDGSLGGGASQTIPGGGTARGVSKNYALGPSASWDTDLWGRIRKQIESSRASAESYAADLESARLSCQIELAQAYFEVRVLDTQRDFYARTIASYEESLKRTKVQHEYGKGSKAPVMQAETQLRATQAQALELDIARAKLENAMAVLLGKPASSFSLPQKSGWEATLPSVPGGFPSTLLERRPDIASRERAVAAANADIGSAEAALYPSFTLGGYGSLEKSSFSRWLSAPDTLWSVSADFVGPIFDGGTRRAEVDRTKAAYDGAVAAYKQTVLNALREVEDNLSSLALLEEQARQQEAALKAAKESEKLTIAQYDGGTVSYLDVVTVQAIALTNERAAAQVQNSRYIALLGLIKALGGTW